MCYLIAMTSTCYFCGDKVDNPLIYGDFKICLGCAGKAKTFLIEGVVGGSNLPEWSKNVLTGLVFGIFSR